MKEHPNRTSRRGKTMKRLALVPLLVCALGCPGEKKKDVAATPPPAPPVDTSTPVDLSKVKANLPPATKEDPRNQKLVPSGEGSAPMRTYPEAPGALMAAVQREQGATRFCYSEFGQKADPTLRGNVALAVTVSRVGISDVHVGDSRWTGNAGSAVNRCLNQRLKQAWKLSPGAVKPGTYTVQLSFSGAQG
jgi:hypothetical protein